MKNILSLLILVISFLVTSVSVSAEENNTLESIELRPQQSVEITNTSNEQLVVPISKQYQSDIYKYTMYTTEGELIKAEWNQSGESITIDPSSYVVFQNASATSVLTIHFEEEHVTVRRGVKSPFEQVELYRHGYVMLTNNSHTNLQVHRATYGDNLRYEYRVRNTDGKLKALSHETSLAAISEINHGEVVHLRNITIGSSIRFEFVRDAFEITYGITGPYYDYELLPGEFVEMYNQASYPIDIYTVDREEHVSYQLALFKDFETIEKIDFHSKQDKITLSPGAVVKIQNPSKVDTIEFKSLTPETNRIYNRESIFRTIYLNPKQKLQLTNELSSNLAVKFATEDNRISFDYSLFNQNGKLSAYDSNVALSKLDNIDYGSVLTLQNTSESSTLAVTFLRVGVESNRFVTEPFREVIIPKKGSGTVVSPFKSDSIRLTNHTGMGYQYTQFDKSNQVINSSPNFTSKHLAFSPEGKIVITNNNDQPLALKYVRPVEEIRVAVENIPDQPKDTASQTFKDVQSHWAKSEIHDLALRRIVNGMTDTTFEPNGQVRRAEFTMMLVRALNLERLYWRDSYADIPVGQWYTRDIETATAAGIVKGDGHFFHPYSPITREEMAAMTMRALNYANSQGLPIGESIKFADSSNISPWAIESVNQASSLEIIKGMNGNRFEPKQHSTRAQAAVVIHRMLNHLNN